MSTSRPCPSCGAGLEEGDRFCPSCGRAAETSRTPTAAEASGTAATTCPFCGDVNPGPVATCAACGARIGEPGRSDVTARRVVKPAQGIGIFQSWKFTLGIGAVLVTALIFIVSSQQVPDTAGVKEDPHDAGMMQRIRELQAHIEEHPRDPDALLEFANLLYDVRFFQRAAEMYERYLLLNPANTDARVDLGTSYFQLSFTDTARGGDMISKAESCFLKAIGVKPEHQLAHFNLGIIHLHRGDMAEANEWLRKSIDIDPTTGAAERARQLLSQHVPNKPS